MSAPLPADEAKRLEALRAYEVLDTAPEEAFDDLTMLAAHICQVPTAMVSLVDERRQWFKSRIGMDAAETSRDGAFCAQAILHADILLEVTDAAADPRFAGSELVVSGPQVRFYAGAPLVTPDGQALGALCVMDRVPRSLTAEQRTALLEGMEGCTLPPKGTARIITTTESLKIPGVRIAGKTGTAQKYVTIDGKSGNINIAWFICFAPIEKPEIAVAVAIVGDTPGEEFGGGRNAGPVAASIMKKYFEKKNRPALPTFQVPKVN